MIDCPSKLTLENPVPPAELPLGLKPEYTIESTPALFPYGQMVRATIQASDSLGLSLECIVDITVKPDTEAPILTCPQDIEQ